MTKIIIIILIPILLLVSVKEILSNTYEIYQHNIGTYGNKVYISNDLHQEAVFNNNCYCNNSSI